MAQPKKPVSGPKFILPHKKEIVITRNGSFSDNGQLVIKDLKNKILLKVVAHDSTFHSQRLVVNTNGKPVMMLRMKLRSIHNRWQAFKGESSSKKDLLFSAKVASNFQEGMDISVFLEKNKKESVYDYKVTGDWRMKSCTVFAREGTGVVAEMHKKRNVTRNGAFGVTVYPNVDYSFIVALVVILGEINSDQSVNDGCVHNVVIGPGEEQVEGGEGEIEAAEDEEEKEEPEEEEGEVGAGEVEEEEGEVEAAEDEEEEEEDEEKEEEEEEEEEEW